jgi:hypothetical protein
VDAPLLIALSPEQEREAAVLLGQLLLDAAPNGAASVSPGALGGVCPSAFDGATLPRPARGNAHRDA